MGLPLSDDELSRLAIALNRAALEAQNHVEGTSDSTLLSSGSVQYQGLLRFYWNLLADSEEREAWIAAQITAAMGTGPAERRQWLEALRQHFFGLDRFQDGVLGGVDFINALADLGVSLDASDGERLLRACGASEMGSVAPSPPLLPGPRGSSNGHDNGMNNLKRWGDVHYSSFLRLVAKHTQQPKPLPSGKDVANRKDNTAFFDNEMGNRTGGGGHSSSSAYRNVGGSGNSGVTLSALRDCLREALQRDLLLEQEQQISTTGAERRFQQKPRTTPITTNGGTYNGGGVKSSGALLSLASLRKLFHKFDRDHDGYLDMKDVAAMVEWLQGCQQELNDIKSDTSHRSSTSNFNRLRSSAVDTQSRSGRASNSSRTSDGDLFGSSAVRQLFAALDEENSGRVSYHGLARFLAQSDTMGEDASRYAPEDGRCAPTRYPPPHEEEEEEEERDNDLRQRCYEAFRALRDQLRPLHRDGDGDSLRGGGMQQVLRHLAHACDQFDDDRSGRLSLLQLERAFRAANLTLPKSDAQVRDWVNSEREEGGGQLIK